MIAEVSPAEFVHRSGQPAALTVRVENVREAIAGISLRVLGADPDWVEIAEPDFSLFPGESRTVSVLVLLPEGFPAGVHPIMVQVQEIGGLGECVLRPVSALVPNREMLLLTLKPHLVHGGKTGRFGLRAENTGNTTVSRPLVGQDDEDQLSFAFTPEHVELGPGENARIDLTVSRRRPLAGMQRPYMFSVYADTRTEQERKAKVPPDGLATQGAFLQKPRISRTVLALGSTLMAMALVIAIAVGTVGAILYKNHNDQKRTDQVLGEVGDPGSHALLTGAEKCPCSFFGRIAIVGDGNPVIAETLKSVSGGWRQTQAALLNDVVVSVYAVDEPDTPVWARPANKFGIWHAQVPAAGDYQIRFGGEGLVPTWYPEVSDRRLAKVVTATGGDTETSVNGATRLPTMLVGIARGSVTVTLNMDDPSGADVQILAGEGTAVPGALVAIGTSEQDDGTFVANNIPTPGSFVVKATKEGYAPEMRPIELGLGENRTADDLMMVKRPVPTQADPRPSAGPCEPAEGQSCPKNPK